MNTLFLFSILDTLIKQTDMKKFMFLLLIILGVGTLWNGLVVFKGVNLCFRAREPFISIVPALIVVGFMIATNFIFNLGKTPNKEKIGNILKGLWAVVLCCNIAMSFCGYTSFIRGNVQGIHLGFLIMFSCITAACPVLMIEVVEGMEKKKEEEEGW